MKEFNPMNLRVGHGTDIHRVKAGDGIMLGGVRIPCGFALIGHSDADLVLHALTDALLGAASMGDIGSWFPDDDPEYSGADSAELLKRVLSEILSKGYKIINADVIITCEKPKLTPYKKQIQSKIADLLTVDSERVNIKAKTNEGCDAVGRIEAMSSLATVLLYRENS